MNLSEKVFKHDGNKYSEHKSRAIIVSRLFNYTVLALLIKSIVLLAFAATNDALTLNFNLPSIYYVSFNNFPFFIYISFIVCILSFALLFREMVQFYFLTGVNVLFSVIFITDLWLFRSYGSFLNINLLEQILNLNIIIKNIVPHIYLMDLAFLIDIAVLVYLRFTGKTGCANFRRSLKLFLVLLTAGILCLSISHYRIDVLKKVSNRTLFYKYNPWNPRWTMLNLSPVGYHIYDTYIYFKNSRHIELSNSDKKNINEWFFNKNENLPDNDYKGVFKNSNLIFIQVESLENFVIGRKISNQEITPTLNKVLKNSLYFSNFYEQVKSGTSSDADFMANTSLYPISVGSTFFRYPNNTYMSLPRMLKDLGYSTLACHPDKGGYWNWMPALYSIGFERCMDAGSFKQNEIIGLGLSDESYLRQLYPKVKDMKQPFYTFTPTITSHGPFDLPQEKRELILDKNLDSTKLGGYFQSIRYTDRHIGEFISKMDREGLLDNTVLVIYGDHGGIHKFYNEELSKIQPFEDWWAAADNKVPLIIYKKDWEGRQIDTIGGEVDILPTVAYLMGVDESKYANTALGRNLLKTDKSFVVLADGKYIGKSSDEEDIKSAVKGMELSDKIIQGNYYKNSRAN